MLFGPSGAGKSTVIAVAAGLLRPDACRVEVDGQVLADTEAGVWLPPERAACRAGVPGRAGCFRICRSPPICASACAGRAPGPVGFDDVVDLLGIAALLTRRPHTLSGGERQRVAIGRALLAQPRLLLMDEPLASLDAARKAEILPYLARLKTALRLPVIYVTHALDEVNRLADTMVLLEAGRVIASGTLSEIAARADLPLAQRDDAGALLLCRVGDTISVGELTRLEGGGATFWVPLLDAAAGGVPHPHPGARGYPGRHGRRRRSACTTSFRVRCGGSPRSRHGGRCWWRSRCRPARCWPRVTPDAITRLGLSQGGPVLALIKSTSIEVLGG